MKIIYLILLLGLIIPSCSNSKDDLLEQVRKSVSVELNKKNLPTFFVRDKIWDSVFKRKINDVGKDDILVRRISRYLQKAKNIISNGKGRII